MKRIETGKIFISLFGLNVIAWIWYGLIMDRQQDAIVAMVSVLSVSLLGYFASARFGKYHEEKNRIFEKYNEKTTEEAEVVMEENK